jgi:hypothetical protein
MPSTAFTVASVLLSAQAASRANNKIMDFFILISPFLVPRLSRHI